MAGFTVIGEPVATFWFPVDYNAVTLYEGQLVSWCFADSGQGLKAWDVAGAADTSVNQNPLGIVVGFNNKAPTFNTTYKGNYGTSVSTQAAQLAREYIGARSMWGPSDPALMAEVAVIDSSTFIKGRIFDTAYGTACDVVTNTTASTDGSTITTAAVDHTYPAYNAMWYCRSGNNMGLYRPSYSASTTSHTFYLTWPYDIAVGDTFVPVAITLGTCKAMFDAVGTYIEQWGNDHATSYTTNYLWLDVMEINLKTAGDEYAIFRINPYQFQPERP